MPAPPLQPELRRFVERVAAYTMAPPGAVLRMAMSVAEALLPPRPTPALRGIPGGIGGARRCGHRETQLTPARRRVLEVLRDGPPLPAAELARLAGCGAGVVRDLIAAGLSRSDLAPAELAGRRSA